MKAESPVKKHHFWILFGFAPLFALIGACTMSSSVGGQIDKLQTDIKSAQDGVTSKAGAKPKQLLAEADKVLAKVGNRKEELHKFNWERQKDLFTWPTGGAPPKLAGFSQLNLKFGDPLPNSEDELAELRKPEVYLNEYSSLRGRDAQNPNAKGTGIADRLAPTQFAGGWQSVLRHVNTWVEGAISSNEVWLAMEDLWVQRSVLSAFKAMNDDMAAFRRAKVENGKYVVDETFDERGNKIDLVARRFVPTPDAEKKKGTFKSRTWAVELEIVTDPQGVKRLTGKLVNLSDKLQLLGNGNTMVLNVWFSKAPTAQPMAFKIGGEYLPGAGATDKDGKALARNEMAIVPIEDHRIPATLGGDEIVRVEQQFDARTVPIKRIDALALGKLDSRAALSELKQPEFIKDPPAATTTTGTDGGGDGGLGSPMPGAPGGPGPSGIGGVGLGGPGGAASGPTRLSGPFTNKQLLAQTKKRYLEITKEVRRLPVGLVVVVDQSHIQDVLLALANSPLRFQITQVSWTRFKGTLAGTAATGGGTGGVGDYFDFASGQSNIGEFSDPDSGPGRFGGGSSLGPPMPPGGGSSLGPPMPPGGGPGFPGPGGPGGPGFPGGGFGTGQGTVSESQITSGLVELSVYGVVSLYEKFVDPKEAEAKEKEKEEKEKNEKKDPMPANQPDPKAGKSRRRARR